MKKQERITAAVTQPTKQAIAKLAKEQERSESYIAGKLLDTAILNEELKK